MILGFLIGAVAPHFALKLAPFRDLFLNGIKCIIAPLIFGSLVSGSAGTGSMKQLGVMGAKAFLYFETVTTLALAVGLLVVNVLKPGVGVPLTQQRVDAVATQALHADHSFGAFIAHLLPQNFIQAVASGDVLQIVVFSTLFAFAVLAAGPKAKPILTLAEGLADTMFKFTGYIMYLAPLGVGSALAVSVAAHGWHVISDLLKLLGSLYLALIIFVGIVFYPVCRMFKIPALAFVRQLKDAIILAFTTTSSESAYPLALESLEKFGVPRRISSFVLPLGYSFNLDGSTLYLALASVFVAQVAGIHLPIGTQLVMMFTLMLSTKGVAAVPRASIVILSGTLDTFHIPLEGVSYILAVDAFMDMARTAVNLLGNCLATAVIARTEGIVLGGSGDALERPLTRQNDEEPITDSAALAPHASQFDVR